jgi:SAM-dependent methyltransferase
VNESHFHRVQRAYSENADPAHYAWQTGVSYFARTEKALLDGMLLGDEDRLLEIGCGEGGNLYHLRGRGRLRVGVDFSRAKAGFAGRHSGAAALCASAEKLPFADASFDVILIRDLLHHVRDREGVLREARRVLVDGGRLTLVEPNIRSPLVRLQAALVPAERGARVSTDEKLRGELARAGLRLTDQRVCQPLPIGRILLHPKLPLRLPLAPLVERFDRAAARLVPRRAWLYLVYQAEKS